MTYDSKANNCERARARTGGLAEKVETMGLLMLMTGLSSLLSLVLFRLLLDRVESTFNVSGAVVLVSLTVTIGGIDVCSASRLE